MKHMINPLPDDDRSIRERFEDLAKQVFTLPKEEFDKRQAEYEKQQEKIKQKKTRQKPTP